MAIVINQTASRPLGVRGTMVGPGEMKEVNIKEADLARHPFVREGWLYVDKSSVPAAKPARKKRTEADDQSSGEE